MLKCKPFDHLFQFLETFSTISGLKVNKDKPERAPDKPEGIPNGAIKIELLTFFVMCIFGIVAK